jgi:hypothetical protein
MVQQWPGQRLGVVWQGATAAPTCAVATPGALLVLLLALLLALLLMHCCRLFIQITAAVWVVNQSIPFAGETACQAFWSRITTQPQCSSHQNMSLMAHV